MEVTINYMPSCQVCQDCFNAHHFADSNVEIGCRQNISLPRSGKAECSAFIKEEELPDLTEHLVEINQSKAG